MPRYFWLLLVRPPGTDWQPLPQAWLQGGAPVRLVWASDIEPFIFFTIHKSQLNRNHYSSEYYYCCFYYFFLQKHVWRKPAETPQSFWKHGHGTCKNKKNLGSRRWKRIQRMEQDEEDLEDVGGSRELRRIQKMEEGLEYGGGSRRSIFETKTNI